MTRLDPLLPIDVCAACGAPRPECWCWTDSGRTLSKRMPRWESREYLAFIRHLPCQVPGCRFRDIEAAHFGPRAAGTKVHDFLAMPLCSKHHREAHAMGRSWEFYDMVNTWQLRTIAAAITSGLLAHSSPDRRVR